MPQKSGESDNETALDIDPTVRRGYFIIIVDHPNAIETFTKYGFQLEKGKMITIRELRPDDNLEIVLRLCEEFFAEYESHHDEFFDTDNLSHADISGKFVGSFESDSSATIVALDDEKIIAYASIAMHEQPQFYKVKRVGSISALMVKKEYRRQGIATQILKEAEAYFRRHGIKYYTFYTAVANQAAIRLYEKLRMAPLHMSFIGET